MLSAFRASLTAAAIAAIGLAGAAAADAKPAQIIGPNSIVLKLCKPHYESKTQYLGIKKIGFKYYRVYRITVVYVNKFCKKTLVRVHYRYVPVPFLLKQKPAGV